MSEEVYGLDHCLLAVRGAAAYARFWAVKYEWREPHPIELAARFLEDLGEDISAVVKINAGRTPGSLASAIEKLAQRVAGLPLKTYDQ